MTLKNCERIMNKNKKKYFMNSLSFMFIFLIKKTINNNFIKERSFYRIIKR